MVERPGWQASRSACSNSLSPSPLLWNNRLTRRRFLRTTGAATAGVVLVGATTLQVLANGSGQKEKLRSGTITEANKIRISGTGSTESAAEANCSQNALLNIASTGAWSYWPAGQPSPAAWSGACTGSLSSLLVSSQQTPGPGLPPFWPWVVTRDFWGTASQEGYIQG